MRILLVMLLAAFSVGNTLAQSTKGLVKALELKMQGASGTNGTAVVFNPINKKYYAGFAGNGSYPLCVFDANGKLVAGGAVTSLIDLRGLWFNAKKAKLQGNGYGDYGWVEYTLDANGIPTAYKTISEGASQPDAQSVGTFIAKTNTIIFFDGFDIYFYDAATGEVKESLSFETVLTNSGIGKGEAESYNATVILYTGIPGKELGLVNVDKNQLELFSLDGKRSEILMVPNEQPLYTSFNVAFANGLYWFFDQGSRTWTGYKEGAVGETKTATTSKPAPTPNTGTQVGVNAGGGKGKPMAQAMPTKIINAGELYSSYDVLNTEKGFRDEWIQLYGEANVKEMGSRSMEGGWPSGISTLDKRNELRAKFKDYTTYKIADLAGEMKLLWVPASKNRHMPAGMIDGKDFYLVIGAKGLSMGDLVQPFSAAGGVSTNTGSTGTATGTGTVTKPITGTLGGVATGGGNTNTNKKGTGNTNPPNSFQYQLNALIEAYFTDFKDVKGGKIPSEEKNELIPKYVSKTALKGAEQSYFIPKFLGDDFIYIAKFGDSETKEQARKKMDLLVAEVEKTKFSIGSMVSLDLIEKEGSINMAWIPFNVEASKKEKYKDMVLEVEVLKLMDFKNDKLVDVWSLLLRVYTLDEEEED